MDENRLLEKIIEEALENAERIIENARDEAGKIVESSEERTRNLRDEIIAKADSDAEAIKRRMLSNATLDLGKEELAAKQRLVESSFKQALERLINLPDERYLEVIERYLLKAAEEGNEEIIISAGDRERINQAFVDRVNEKIKADGKEGSLTISEETREISGGFILKGSGYEINCTFDSLILRQLDELEPLVVERLFSSR